MKMNKLINVISELFISDDTIKIYSYDNKVLLYGILFSHGEIDRIMNLIKGEGITLEIHANANMKACIQLIME